MADLKRWAVDLALGLIVTVAVVFFLDWAIWKTRVAHGGGVGSVKVRKVLVAHLKANKEEYEDDGTVTVECSESVFPQTGAGACWWVRGHRTVFR